MGVIRRVNAAERYAIVECRQAFPSNLELRVWRDEHIVATLRARSLREKHMQAADIVEGVPAPGDLVELARPVQAEPGQQGQSGGFGPQDRRSQ